MIWALIIFKSWRISLPLSVVLLLVSCRNDSAEDFFGRQNDPASSEYRVQPKALEEKGVHVKIKTRNDLQKGEVVLMMNVRNDSHRSIMVDYMNCALNIDEERVAAGQVTRPYKSTISSDDEENYEIYFRPINSLDFYNTTEYCGDMKQQYSIDLNFITDYTGQKVVNQRVVLALPDTTYHGYLQQDAREQFMRIFAFDFNSEKFDFQEAQYLNKILGPVHADELNAAHARAIYSINPAIMIDRMIINIFSYQEKDTLIVNMRMLNEDTHRLKVIPDKCVVKLAGLQLKPDSHFSDTFDDGQIPDSAYIFKPGTRLHLRLKYYAPQKFESWTMSNDWLLVNTEVKPDRWATLFFDDLMLKEFETTHAPLLNDQQ
jgi:hypothetical protein